MASKPTGPAGGPVLLTAPRYEASRVYYPLDAFLGQPFVAKCDNTARRAVPMRRARGARMTDHPELFAKVARRLIPLMVALYTVAFLDRVNLGFAALTMNKDLSFTPEIYGWGAAFFFYGYFFFQAPSTVALPRVHSPPCISPTLPT